MASKSFSVNEPLSIAQKAGFNDIWVKYEPNRQPLGLKFD